MNVILSQNRTNENNSRDKKLYLLILLILMYIYVENILENEMNSRRMRTVNEVLIIVLMLE